MWERWMIGREKTPDCAQIAQFHCIYFCVYFCSPFIIECPQNCCNGEPRHRCDDNLMHTLEKNNL